MHAPDAPDARLHSPAAERNTAPILAQLQALLPARGLMLEIASGTGQHAAAFSTGLPGWEWQPTDFESTALDSISAWCQGLHRVRAPVPLDVLSETWPPQLPPVVDAMFCANMIHIAPWACTSALMLGAARHLSDKGVLITYGPYLEEATPTAPGNLAFDADLRQRNPAWGLRQLGDVAVAAGEAGLLLHRRISLPANNLLLVWARA
jgi:hypothetical protein